MDNLEQYEREFKLLTASNTVTIEASFTHGRHGLYPDSEGYQHHAVFNVLDVVSERLIRQLTTINVMKKYQGQEKPFDMDIDSEVYNLMLVRVMMKSWSLSALELDDDGYLTWESFQSVIKHPAPVVSSFVERYKQTFSLSESETKTIERQGISLFSSSGRGVTNACDAVNLYCMLSGMWEKFGLNYHDLKQFPFKDYRGLRILMDKEIERQKADMNKHKGPQTQVAGRGGRIRPMGHKTTIENP